MMSRLSRYGTVAIGDLFSKIDKHPSTWEVVEIVTPEGHYPHARLSCVGRPTDLRMIAIAALHDKRLYLEAGTAPRLESEDPPVEEPRIAIPEATPAQTAATPAADMQLTASPETETPPARTEDQGLAPPEPRRKSSMRAVFDELEQGHQAA